MERRPSAKHLYASNQIDTLESGEINYEDFEAQISANATRPAIVNVNIGTTVKGAVDDLDRILSILERTGYTEDRFYIHCDGALFGLMVRCIPFSPRLSCPRGHQCMRQHGGPPLPVDCTDGD